MLILCLVMPLVFVGFTLNPSLVSGQPETTIYIDPTPVTAFVCQNFTVAVNVKDVTDLYAWQLKLSWNPDLLECVGYSFGPFLPPPTIQPPPIIDNTAGWIVAGDSRMMPPGVSGSGTIFYIEFHCDGPGECDLVFVYPDTFLLDSTLTPIPHNAVNGHVIQKASTLDVELYPREVVDLEDPTSTQWHELHPSKTNYYHLMSWEPGYVLSPEDQIDMYLAEPPVQIYVETGFVDPFAPICSYWHEIEPTSQEWHLTSWEDNNGDGYLSPCDQIDMTPEPTAAQWDEFWSMGDVNRDGYINLTDLNRIAEKFGWTGPPGGIPEDINSDGAVNFQDVNICTSNQGLDIWTYFGIGIEKVWFHVQEVIPPDPLPGPKQMVLDVKYWFQVDEVTVDMLLSQYEMPGPQIFVEYKCGYWTFDPKNPICTKWNQIDPELGPTRCLHLTSWEDNGNGVLDPSDIIDMTPLYPNPGPVEYYHVDFLSISLKLTPKPSPPVVPPPPFPDVPVYLESALSYDEFDLSRPVCTKWHEIYPVYSRIWHLSSWENFYGLSPSDQIVLALKDEFGEPIPGTEAEYHVDKLTVAMNLTSTWDGREHIVKFEESLKEFKMYHWTDPVSTQWHEVNPEYCRQWHIMYWWDENPDGLLGYCDYILMIDKHTGWEEVFHVESLSTDMWLTLKLHDVAVTAVSSRYPVVYQGQIDPIDVTVTNLGDFNEPTVDVYAYYDGNLAAPKQTTSLNMGDTKTLTFNWNTLAVPPGVYTISAKAVIPIDDVPGNNYLSDGTQEVKRPPPEILDVELYPRKVVDLEDPTSTQWHELHPSKTNYYHLMSWEPGYVLSPEDQIDMYLIDPPVQIYVWTEFVNPFAPICTIWHEMMPEPWEWHLTSWEDNNGDGYLSPCDQIDMTNTMTGDVVWFHVREIIPPDPAPGPKEMLLDVKYWFQVDEVTVDMTLTPTKIPGPQIFVEYKCGYWTFDPKNPICTKWNQIDPELGPFRCLHLTSWIDNGNGVLDPSDIIDMTPLYPNPGPIEYYHVDFISISLKLTPKPSPPVVPPPPEGPMYLESALSYDEFDLSRPVCTKWHEIYPYYSRIWHLSSWENFYGLSPSDQIVLALKDEFGEPIPGTEAEYHVDKLTVAMNITSVEPPFVWHIVKFEESLKEFKMYHWTNPVSTQWHEVNPEYCRQWHIMGWEDNGDGYLGYCDYILMIDKHTGYMEWFHVESLSTDMWLTIAHDIAVTDVTPYKTIVGQGYDCPVDVTVTNEGYFTETFSLTLYAETMPPGTPIKTVTVSNLLSGETRIITFTWNTTGFTKGLNYTIWAYAWPVVGEIDIADNTKIDGKVFVTIAGDVTGEGLCDIQDISIMVDRFLAEPGDPLWDPNCDVNGDLIIDIADISIAVDNFLQDP